MDQPESAILLKAEHACTEILSCNSIMRALAQTSPCTCSQQLTFGVRKMERDGAVWPLVIVHDIAWSPRVQWLQSLGKGIAPSAFQVTLQHPLKTCGVHASYLAVQGGDPGRQQKVRRALAYLPRDLRDRSCRRTHTGRHAEA